MRNEGGHPQPESTLIDPDPAADDTATITTGNSEKDATATATDAPAFPGSTRVVKVTVGWGDTWPLDCMGLGAHQGGGCGDGWLMGGDREGAAGSGGRDTFLWTSASSFVGRIAPLGACASKHGTAPSASLRLFSIIEGHAVARPNLPYKVLCCTLPAPSWRWKIIA